MYLPIEHANEVAFLYDFIPTVPNVYIKNTLRNSEYQTISLANLGNLGRKFGISNEIDYAPHTPWHIGSFKRHRKQQD
jgi:hypothetical protein